MLSLFTNTLLVPELIDVVAVETVTIPAEISVTSRPFAKLIVPAVPTVEPLSNTTTPEPEPITFVNPEPSPTNAVSYTHLTLPTSG